MYTALRLQRRLRPNEATITVVDPQSFMTYQPFVPQVAAGHLERREKVSLGGIERPRAQFEPAGRQDRAA
jgi:NADH dehydrogenase FAD-containing subunit